MKRLKRMMRVFAAATLVLVAAGSAQADVFNLGGSRDPVTGTWTGVASLETVPVRDAGNTADSTGFGSVAYTYSIGKYDVTAGQYTAFLNAVATTDTYGLYNPSMASDVSTGCQIQRTGSSGSYAYSVSPTYANRPVNYVSFWDACRFSNWLNNGQGGAATTEYGAYTLTTSGMANNTITRNTSATWAVANDNEWYKAAFYNGTSGVYNLYAIGGNSITTAMANYDSSVGHPTDVGAYLYASPYGTFDQNGDVWEWDEANINGTWRRLRGGTYSLDSSYLPSSYPGGISGPGDESSVVGFRVMEVPEPATMSLLALAGLAILRRRVLRQ